jgi:NAD(P)-dependent dehydrogenase (short-subunit alcohol dehydrogenase family)
MKLKEGKFHLEMQLRGDTVVVIGAAQGIGKAIAEAFAREGARVAALDAIPCSDTLAEELRSLSQNPALTMQVDATDYTAMQRAASTIKSELGICRHLVYAAGVGSGKFGFPFWNLEPHDWNRVLQVNLLGAVHAAHAFSPDMVQAQQGTLLFLASVAGQIGSQTDPPYSAAKAALINFMQCVAKDLAPYQIRANALSPGMVRTTLNRAVWQAWAEGQAEESRLSYEQWAVQKVQRVAPLGNLQEPEEMAAMAVFLASPHAKSITGQTLNVDGGQVMHS